jgi:hypothetical protein
MIATTEVFDCSILYTLGYWVQEGVIDDQPGRANTPIRLL